MENHSWIPYVGQAFAFYRVMSFFMDDKQAEGAQALADIAGGAVFNMAVSSLVRRGFQVVMRGGLRLYRRYRKFTYGNIRHNLSVRTGRGGQEGV